MATPDRAALPQYTSVGTTGETTIVTADSTARHGITQIVVTTVNAAASTLTLKDGTGGTTRGVFNYPNAASAPSTPLVLSFDPPLQQDARNSNWTLTASANASGYNVTVSFVKQS